MPDAFRRFCVYLLLLGLSAPHGWSRQPVRAANAMVVAQEPIASQVGAKVLESGGNAVDAAVATALALAVTYPFAGNLGGGGFLLVRMNDGRATFFDFREKAPLAASRDMYLDAQGNPTRDSLIGWRASGVPGTVRGLEAAHKKYGKKAWKELATPAVDLAKNGFPVSYALATSLRGAGEVKAAAKDNSVLTSGGVLLRSPDAKRILLRDTRFYEPGEKLVQAELGATLERIRTQGAKGFYEGETARILAEEMARNGGLITEEDLRRYQCVEREPLRGAYRGYEVITAAPPSTGGVTMLQVMGMLEPTEYAKGGLGSASVTHYVGEAMRRAFADRGKYLGDPDFTKLPMKGLLSKAYLDQLRGSIDLKKAGVSANLANPAVERYESGETTHFSIVDAEGNAAALTYTINGGYGSGVMVPRLGFLMNNEMDDFAARPGRPNMFKLIEGEANSIAPGKRPNSSMTPTILLRDGKLAMVLGAPGGSRIGNGVLQVILNVIDHGLNIQDAIDAPRLHHQWMPDRLYLERGFSPDTIEILKSMGHTVEAGTFGVARVEAIQVETRLGKRWLAAGVDGRGDDGRATGY
jgi:gamma-glutamyltranspeptidase/glutathione hydrolase